jgi:two-component sensor histidine kinase
VKNSLQLVRTMLGLQARSVSDEAREQLDMAAGRIMSIAAVHQRLYEGGSVADGDAVVYLDGLLDDMRGMLEETVDGRSIVLRCEAMTLSADALTPLGLIVSELVTNALKYGEGRIDVTVERDPRGVRIMVEDEGARFPLEGSPQRGLGMRLISALAKRPPGEAIVVDPAVPHSRVVVTLPL